jgi:hypothetical protein
VTLDFFPQWRRRPGDPMMINRCCNSGSLALARKRGLGPNRTLRYGWCYGSPVRRMTVNCLLGVRVVNMVIRRGVRPFFNTRDPEKSPPRDTGKQEGLESELVIFDCTACPSGRVRQLKCKSQCLVSFWVSRDLSSSLHRLLQLQCG